MQKRNLKKAVQKARILVGAPAIGKSAYITGNAAGLHGGRKLKYGKQQRRQNRAEEAQQADEAEA